jgi:hypothetical protein
MMMNIRKCAAEKNALNKELKKLEHKIAKMLKVDDKHNTKQKMIKSMCDK